ncbi:MAG: FAD-dependent oxidoreductase [Clostridiaceae bacterium]|nr:FAD-dependent oxidoreductase [Clostridiaceae bacterium]
MEQLDFSRQALPLRGDYDVVVAGGGTAGALAGIAAARSGCLTLIVEQLGCLGGSATAGQVTPLMSSGLAVNPGHCPLGLEVNSRLEDLGGCSRDGHLFDPTLLACVLEEMAVTSGCRLRYHTQLVGAIRDGDTVKAAVICNKDGIGQVTARQFIDATGDADLALLAGETCSSGDRNGRNQAVSLRFEMAGIDFDAFHAGMRRLGYNGKHYFAMNTPGMAGLLAQAEQDGLLEHQDVVYFQAFGIPGKPDAMSFNCPELTTRAGVTDAAFLSAKQVEGKRAVLRLRRFLRERVSGFEKAYITQIAPMVGIRESRRVDAQVNLTIQDVLAYRKFPDAIISCAYPVDVHGGEEGDSLRYDASVPEAERYWQVPYRILVAKVNQNLQVAGRCAGMDFMAQSAARIQLVCRAMGEAAGLAAAAAIKQPGGLRALDPVSVRKLLADRGMVI